MQIKDASPMETSPISPLQINVAPNESSENYNQIKESRINNDEESVLNSIESTNIIAENYNYFKECGVTNEEENVGHSSLEISVASTESTENCNDIEEYVVTSNEGNIGYSPLEISAGFNESRENDNDIEECSNTNVEGNVEYSVECSSTRKEKKIPSGRFFCDLNLVIQQARAVEAHSYSCNFGGKLIFNEMKRNGLVCTLKFVRENPLCPTIKEITTDSQKDNVNELAVLGAMSTGSSFSQEEEKFSTIEVKYMSRYKFSFYEKKAGNIVQSCAQDTMEKNIYDEIKAAEARGGKDNEGCYRITAVVDGGWSKRSYGRGYNASTGVAIIVGAATKKIIFIGIRNKLCTICRAISTKKIPYKEHVCYKNWNNSSTAMESDIIVDGLNYLKDTYNIKCLRIIGDGDSNTMSRIREKVSYGRTVVKIECANHAVRRFRRALERLHVSANCKILKDKIPAIISFARKIIKYYCIPTHSEPTKEQINQFIEKLHNIPEHISGNHSDCGNYCKEKQNLQNLEENVKKILLPPDLKTRIIDEMNKTLISCANTLIFNVTNNLVESYMSWLCKTSGGKRVDFSRSGGMNRRAHIALLSY